MVVFGKNNICLPGVWRILEKEFLREFEKNVTFCEQSISISWRKSRNPFENCEEFCWNLTIWLITVQYIYSSAALNQRRRYNVHLNSTKDEIYNGYMKGKKIIQNAIDCVGCLRQFMSDLIVKLDGIHMIFWDVNL